jgi:hypothetical protein
MIREARMVSPHASCRNLICSPTIFSLKPISESVRSRSASPANMRLLSRQKMRGHATAPAEAAQQAIVGTLACSRSAAAKYLSGWNIQRLPITRVHT